LAEKILVIDDDIISQNMLRSTLTQAGYSVIFAGDGKEGLEKATRELPGLIILDIMMPGMDGGDVANLLKENPKTKEIPVIFLSSLVENEQIKSCGLNKVSFLSKPYNKDALLNQIKKCSSGVT
jgi:CheY-like chemotaxis protein